MPVPASLTTTPHRDFDLHVVSGTRPTDVRASPGRFAWQSRSIQTLGKRLFGRHPEQFSASPVELHPDVNDNPIDLRFLHEDTPCSRCSFECPSMERKGYWEYPDVADHITSLAFVPRGAAPGRYTGGEPGGHDGYVVQPVCNDDGFRVEFFDEVSAEALASVPEDLHAAVRAVANECDDLW